MDNDTSHATSIERYYIDTRPLVPHPGGFSRTAVKTDLPLLSTLPQEIQENVQRFLRQEDKFMSLASALLKFTFIHRLAKVPWSEIEISKTPKPHVRPFWDPPASWQGEDGARGLEFNVSHQAGIVILAGCRTPGRPQDSLGISQGGAAVVPDPKQQQQRQIRIGVDVACTKEVRRTPDLTTQAKLDEWVDTFAEMFSARERRDMKVRDVKVLDRPGGPMEMEAKGRRFYMYWALKEAYIKMVGEGLLAGWLKRLEFVDVVTPGPGQRLTPRESGMKVMFEGADITDSVEVEMDGFEDTFLFAMMTRGLTEQSVDKAARSWKRLDIETDVRPCAEGRCSCLS